MHVKRIHEMLEKLTESASCELEKGIECVNTEEMGEVADIIKDLAEAEYYAKISKAMDEAEYGEDYDYMGAYDERRYYRGQPRSKTSGRYMKRGDGRRMGYDEPPYYHMTPGMYRDWETMSEEERNRDIDRLSHGRMYYTEPVTMTTGSTHRADGTRDMRDTREGKSGMMRKGYMEAKEMGMDKTEKMKSLEDYMKELSTDVTDMIHDASPEEKAMLKQKMQVLMAKIQ